MPEGEKMWMPVVIGGHNLLSLHCNRVNPKGGGGGSKCPIGQDVGSHFSKDYAMVTKILDFIDKHPN